jgi:hypothetical protein
MTQYIPLPRQAKDITGQRFGRLIALGPVGRNRHGNLLWICRCDCGNETTVSAITLRAEHTRSCGCLSSDTTSQRNYIHGKTHTHIYNVWAGIKARCFDVNSRFFADYGGRGITLWPEWIDDFAAFFAYVVSLPHFEEDGYTLDRIDNDGNYEPGNLRWATWMEQARNRRSSRLISVNGETRTAAEWSEISGIASGTIRYRLKVGWSEVAAVFGPVRQKDCP